MGCAPGRRCRVKRRAHLRAENGNLNLHSGLEGDGGDLLDDLRGGVEVDQTLVNAHLVAVPGLGTLTTGRLAHGVGEDLGGQTDGALDAELLVLGALDKVVADLLEVLDVAAGEGDADLVDLGGGGDTLDILLLGDVAHLVVGGWGLVGKTIGGVSGDQGRG